MGAGERAATWNMSPNAVEPHRPTCNWVCEIDVAGVRSASCAQVAERKKGCRTAFQMWEIPA